MSCDGLGTCVQGVVPCPVIAGGGNNCRNPCCNDFAQFPFASRDPE